MKRFFIPVILLSLFLGGHKSLHSLEPSSVKKIAGVVCAGLGAFGLNYFFKKIKQNKKKEVHNEKVLSGAVAACSFLTVGGLGTLVSEITRPSYAKDTDFFLYNPFEGAKSRPESIEFSKLFSIEKERFLAMPLNDRIGFIRDLELRSSIKFGLFSAYSLFELRQNAKPWEGTLEQWEEFEQLGCFQILRKTDMQVLQEDESNDGALFHYITEDNCLPRHDDYKRVGSSFLAGTLLRSGSLEIKLFDNLIEDGVFTTRDGRVLEVVDPEKLEENLESVKIGYLEGVSTEDLRRQINFVYTPLPNFVKRDDWVSHSKLFLRTIYEGALLTAYTFGKQKIFLAPFIDDLFVTGEILEELFQDEPGLLRNNGLQIYLVLPDGAGLLDGYQDLLERLKSFEHGIPHWNR